MLALAASMRRGRRGLLCSAHLSQAELEVGYASQARGNPPRMWIGRSRSCWSSVPDPHTSPKQSSRLVAAGPGAPSPPTSGGLGTCGLLGREEET